MTQCVDFVGSVNIGTAAIRFVLPKLAMQARADGAAAPSQQANNTQTQSFFYNDAQHIFVCRLSSGRAALSRRREVTVSVDGLTTFVHPLCAPVLTQLIDSIQYQKRKYQTLLKKMFASPVNEVSRGIHKMWETLKKKTDAQLSGLRKFFRQRNQASSLSVQVAQVKVAVAWHTCESASPPQVSDVNTNGAEEGTSRSFGADDENDLKNVNALLSTPIELLLLTSRSLTFAIHIRKTLVGDPQHTKVSPTADTLGDVKTFVTDAKFGVERLQIQTTTSSLFSMRSLSEVSAIALLAEVESSCSRFVLLPLEQFDAKQKFLRQNSSGPGVRFSRQYSADSVNSETQTATQTATSKAASWLQCCGVLKIDSVRASVRMYAPQNLSKIGAPRHGKPGSSEREKEYLKLNERPKMVAHVISNGLAVVASPSMAQHVSACVNTTTMMQKLRISGSKQLHRTVSRERATADGVSNAVSGSGSFDWAVTSDFKGGSAVLSVKPNLLTAVVHGGSDTSISPQRLSMRPGISPENPLRRQSIIQTLEQSKSATRNAVPAFGGSHILVAVPNVSSRVICKRVSGGAHLDDKPVFRTVVVLDVLPVSSTTLPDSSELPVFEYLPHDFIVARLFMRALSQNWATAQQRSRSLAGSLQSNSNSPRLQPPFLLSHTTISLQVRPFVLSFAPLSATVMPSREANRAAVGSFSRSGCTWLSLRFSKPIQSAISFDRDKAKRFSKMSNGGVYQYCSVLLSTSSVTLYAHHRALRIGPLGRYRPSLSTSNPASPTGNALFELSLSGIQISQYVAALQNPNSVENAERHYFTNAVQITADSFHTFVNMHHYDDAVQFVDQWSDAVNIALGEIRKYVLPVDMSSTDGQSNATGAKLRSGSKSTKASRLSNRAQGSVVRVVVPDVILEVDLTQWVDTRAMIQLQSLELFKKTSGPSHRKDAARVSNHNRTSVGVQCGGLDVTVEGRLQGHVVLDDGFGMVRVQNMLCFDGASSGNRADELLEEVPVTYFFLAVTPANIDLNHCLRPLHDSVHETKGASKGVHHSSNFGRGSRRNFSSVDETLPMFQAETGCMFVKWRDAPLRLLSKKDRSFKSFVRAVQKLSFSSNSSLNISELSSGSESFQASHPQGSSSQLASRNWGVEMVLHCDSILCSGVAQNFSGFRSILSRMMLSHGESFQRQSPASFMTRIRHVLRAHKRVSTSSSDEVHEGDGDSRGSGDKKSAFVGEVRLLVVRSQCEFVDRDANHGIIFSLGNLATRLHVSTGAEPGQVHDAAASVAEVRKLEIMLLTAALRFRVGQGASSTLRDVLTLPNSKLRMLTREPIRASVVQLVEYITQWESHIKLSTDIRLYEKLKKIFSNLNKDLRSPHGSTSDFTRSSRVGRDRQDTRRRKKEYLFDDCDIVLNPQLDVLKGLTPSFDQVLVQLGSSTPQFISGTDSIVRSGIERLARMIRDLANSVGGGSRTEP